MFSRFFSPPHLRYPSSRSHCCRCIPSIYSNHLQHWLPGQRADHHHRGESAYIRTELTPHLRCRCCCRRGGVSLITVRWSQHYAVPINRDGPPSPQELLGQHEEAVAVAADGLHGEKSPFKIA